MKKLLVILFFALPIIGFSQVSNKDAKAIKEAAMDLEDLANGIEPTADYTTINNYLVKNNISTIGKTSLHEYKYNGHYFYTFSGQKKSAFVFWINKEKKVSIVSILLSPTCDICKVQGGMTYAELEQKAYSNTAYQDIKEGLSSFLANLMYNDDYLKSLMQ